MRQVGRRIRVQSDPVVELFVAELGDAAGSPLLVIHGGPDWDGSYLREPLVQLAGRRILLPDLRGCGRSTRGLPRTQYHWDLVISDLIALVDKGEHDQVDVLGFSTGGLIAQRLALVAPERVRRLVIASSSILPVPDGSFGNWPERARRAAEMSRPDPAIAAGPELTRAWAISSAEMNVWRPERLPEYLDRLGQISFSGDWADVWLAGGLPSARPTDALARLGDVGLPILLLHGRQDMTFPARLAEQAADELPNAQATIIDQAGHMAHIDQPEAWLSAVLTFLIS